MKLVNIIGFLFLGATLSGHEAWNDISVFRINKENPHAFYIVYPNFAEASIPLSIDDIANPYSTESYKSLNGDWKFFFAKSHSEVKGDFYKRDFDDSSWADIDVPNSWQCRGFDRIFYDNQPMEFFFDFSGNMYPDFEYGNIGGKKTVPLAAQKPYIPEAHRQVGVYRKKFVLPANWNGKAVFVQFHGVRTGFNLYVNGNFVGYSEDSFTPAEFDITKYIDADGENSIVAEVFKYTTGAYMEMQDMPHVVGIVRDVLLVARNPLHVEDYYAPAKLSADLSSAEIDFSVKIRNKSPSDSAKCKLEAYLLDSGGKPIGGSPLFTREIPELKGNSAYEISEKKNVGDVNLWSPDNPVLYSLAFRLVDADGGDIETVAADYGFKKFDIDKSKRQLTLNGKRFFIKGTNHHDWSPDKGKAMSFEWMKKDMILMKRANINSLRTSHYPKDSRFYMLCSRFGIMVMDECNHEMHYFRDRPAASDLEIYIPASVDRMRNMVLRDRNIPCISIFSVGNESSVYYTKTLRAMELEGRRLSAKSGHFIHSEAETGDIVNGRANGDSDFFSPMYGGTARMKNHLKKHVNETRPFFFCEYFHCMGNTLGDFRNTWSFIRSQDALNGGYIWDWVDQALYLPQKNDSGSLYLSDARDWGTVPNKENYCLNGVVFADRTYSAKYFEVARVYQDIQIESAGRPGELSLSNEFISTNVDSFLPIVSIERDGKVIAEKYLEPIHLPAGEKKSLKLDMPAYDSSKPGEYFYTLSFLRTRHTPYARRGELVAKAQFPLDKKPYPEIRIEGGRPSVSAGDSSIVVKSGGAEIVFDKISATLLSYSYNGKKLVVSPVEFDFKVAWMDNFNRHLKARFDAAMLDKLLPNSPEISVKELEDRVVVNCSSKYLNANKSGFETRVAYIILPNGFVNVSASLKKIGDIPKNVIVPRLGLRMGIGTSFDNVKFFGRGPFANYPDRLYSADIGMYSLKASDFFEPYTKLQDTGNREGVRFFALGDYSGAGILVSMPDSPNPVALLPWTQSELLQAERPYMLGIPKVLDLRIAYKVSGLGSNSCGPEPKKEFVIDLDKLGAWSFTLMPFSDSTERDSLMKVRLPPAGNF